ncbi:MAG TPA: hypothetical protein VF172_06430 [Nitrososphaera sp.]|jgi:hypothetical protein
MSAAKETRRNLETKGGSGPAANAYFNPERGYGTSEQKEKIEQAGQ